MVSPQKIRYNNIFSDVGLGTLDVILDVAFDSDNGTMSSYLNRSAVASESYDGRYKNTTRYKFDELFSPQFTIVKKDFSNFTQEEVRKVLKYLTSTDKPALLEVYYDGNSNIVDWACIGGWTSIEMYKIANNRTVGILAKFEAITPYAMSDLYTVTKTISSPTDNKITINIDTDDNKPVYPCVTIKHNGSVVRIPDGTVLTTASDMVENTTYYNGTSWYWKSDKACKCTALKAPTYTGWATVTVTSSADIKYADKTIYLLNGVYYWLDPYYFKASSTNPSLATTSVKLTNKHTDFLNKSRVIDSTIVKNNNSTETITLDGANKIIYSDSVNRVFDADFNLTWLPLLDGKNEIAVEGNCTVTLKWREVRKIGEY
jgi:hypothetical protein